MDKGKMDRDVRAHVFETMNNFKEQCGPAMAAAALIVPILRRQRNRTADEDTILTFAMTCCDLGARSIIYGQEIEKLRKRVAELEADAIGSRRHKEAQP